MLGLALCWLEQLYAEELPSAPLFEGPVRVSNHYALHQLHLSWAPRSPLVTFGAESRFEARWGWSNTALQRDSYRVDLESHLLELDLTQPLTERLELGVKLPLIWRGSGVLDEPIDNWHKAFQLPRGDRDDMPQDDYNISGLQANGDDFEISEDGFGVGNVSISGAYLLSKERQKSPALAIVLEAGLPGASRQFGQTGVDLLSGVVLSQNYKSLAWYSGIAALYFSDAQTEQVQFRRHHLESFLSLEYLALQDLSLLLSLYGSTQLLESLPEHANYFLYLDLGLRYRLTTQSSATFLVRENPGGGVGSTDITFVAALSYKP